MTPIPFKEQNIVFAKDQPEYKELPAFKDDIGTVLTCWKLSRWERVRLLWTGKLWAGVMTFDKPLMPMFFSTYKSDFRLK